MRVRRYLARTIVWLLPLCFIVGVFFLVRTGWSEIHTLAAPDQIAAGTPPGPPAMTAAELKTRLDDLKWLLTLLVIAAGFFAIAQAAAAWFNAQTFTKQSEDAIKRILDLAKDVEARYPVFARTEEIRREAYRSLALSLQDEGNDWRESLYERMPLPERQRLLSVERFIGLEFLPHIETDEAYVRNLRRLANFYASKYKYEHVRNASHLADLEHAAYYLKLACGLTGDAFYLVTDLGLLYLEFFRPSDPTSEKKYLSEAINCFNTSLRKHSHQQRAHYNLGVAADDAGDLLQAVKHSEDALAIDPPLWEFRAVPEMHCQVLYNLACYCAKLSYADKSGKLRPDAAQWRDQAVKRLKEAAEIGQLLEKTVSDDYEKYDLRELVDNASPALKQELMLLRPRLSARRGEARPAETSWRQRLSAAWKTLIGKKPTDLDFSQS